MNMGSPHRPLSTEEPQLHDLLPTNDASWDEGASFKANHMPPKVNSDDIYRLYRLQTHLP